MSTPRTVLITGGNRGIGYAIAEEFVAAGHRVAVTARSGEGPTGSLTVRADVTDTAALDAAFTEVEEKLGPVEVVVSNAGIGSSTMLIRATDAQIDDIIDTNLVGSIRVARRAVRSMAKQRRGQIVFVSSISAMYGVDGTAIYAASKSGLIGLARAIAREYGPRNVRANVVAPGAIATTMLDEAGQQMLERELTGVPLRRTGTADEVASVVAFLASDAAAYITGAVLPVGGGGGMGF